MLAQAKLNEGPIITHLQPLADRMPVRITVNKSPVGSTLTID